MPPDPVPPQLSFSLPPGLAGLLFHIFCRPPFKWPSRRVTVCACVPCFSPSTTACTASAVGSRFDPFFFPPPPLMRLPVLPLRLTPLRPGPGARMGHSPRFFFVSPVFSVETALGFFCQPSSLSPPLPPIGSRPCPIGSRLCTLCHICVRCPVFVLGWGGWFSGGVDGFSLLSAGWRSFLPSKIAQALFDMRPLSRLPLPLVCS